MATRLEDRLEDRKGELLERVVDQLHDRLQAKRAALAEAFVLHYYHGVPAAELLERDQLDLYGAALSHLRLGEQRQRGTAKVRVYNPQVEQDGWQSTHTVVEIVVDDMPFLVDSASMALNRLGLLIHVTIHPVIALRRDAKDTLQSILLPGAPEAADLPRDSFMHFEVDRQSDPERLEAIHAALEQSLADVAAAVEDWRSDDGQGRGRARGPETRRQRDRAGRAGGGGGVPGVDRRRPFRLLRLWLLRPGPRPLAATSCAGSRARRSDCSAVSPAPPAPTSRSFAALSAEVRKQAREPVPLLITKANARSTVHRPVYLDYIGVRRFDAKGKVIGEHRFLGLFTSAAYNRNPRRIPLLRHKVARIVERAGLPADSHSGKALANILETYPRDELFQTKDDELFPIAQAILHLQERQQIRLFLRRDAFARFVSCLVYIPRERYNTEIRRRFQDILQEALGGTEVEFQAQVSESILARIQFIVRTPEGISAEVEARDIEARLVEAARSWSDILYEALIDAEGEEDGNRLFRAFGAAMPTAYQELVPARAAVPDIVRIDQLARGERDIVMSLSRPPDRDQGELRFKLGRAGSAIALSDVLPVLENMGLRVIQEQPYAIRASKGGPFWLHDFRLQPLEVGVQDPEAVRNEFQEAFVRVWRGDAENDGFNRLVLGAGLDWRQVMVLRAYCKYLLQLGIPFSQAYMEETLAGNPGLARQLGQLFQTRFDPAFDGDRPARMAELEAEYRVGLDHVANLDEDRILRRYMRLILATLRTNLYQPGADGSAHKPYFSLKIDPASVPEMPLPRPAFEIFVYSPRMEGVHLRGGKVARGGIRWSDRREDFRTEVLGLMKAQMVKNGVIVPVGAKGGFVVKRPPKGGDRAALQAEVVACYQTLMRGMLDITDNRVEDGIRPPAAVVRYDDDDPYLVVAADKGTATFSDIANGISQDYGHWLGDAFASGGSAGYDHKGMAITARGAWESVKRHFLELGKDCQSEPFTVIGIGDMSGDVFGNGMLLSEQIRLIAAFDHRHVFIDPNPDPATSFAERKRLFDLPRSSWDDYERSQLSQGGGIWPRSAKSIVLSVEARQALDIEAEALSPSELIKAILLAPVELFWNGGIGTWVKAASERHADAFDRGNDALRADAEQLRCKIIGEGGNLGLTQKARIAFAQKGGRINTDFIDNSAGVDCSDHEVNIKILLDAVVQAGDMTGKQRNQLLARMTDEVAELCLRNNILQVQAISLAVASPAEMLDTQASYIRRLEASGRLNRELEELPDDETLAERRQAGQGLTRPEVALLVAYAKMTLFDELLASDLPDDPYLAQDLIKYFPRPLRRKFGDQIVGHRLRREITATLVANSLVNRGLGELVDEAAEQTGQSVATIARAYIVARDAFQLVPMFGRLEMLASTIGAERQVALLGEARWAVIQTTHWFLANLPSPMDISAAVERFGPGVASLVDRLDQVLSDVSTYEAAFERHRAQEIDELVARRLAALPLLDTICEVVVVAEEVGVDVLTAAKVYFSIGATLRLHRLRRRLDGSGAHDHWERLALAGLYDDLFREQRRLAIEALTSAEIAAKLDDPALDADRAIAGWLDQAVQGFGRWQRLLAELESQPSADLAMLAVAVRQLGAVGGGERLAPIAV